MFAWPSTRFAERQSDTGVKASAPLLGGADAEVHEDFEIETDGAVAPWLESRIRFTSSLLGCADSVSQDRRKHWIRFQ